jgi:hypothetical protein
MHTGMNNGSGKLIVIVLCTCILGGLGLLGGIVYLRAPGAPPPGLPPATLFVTLLRPVNESEAQVGIPVAVSAEAVSTQPLQVLELWVDGVPVIQSAPLAAGLKQFNTLWNWKPEQEGEHILQGRARDASGQVMNSNLVRVTVKPATLPSPPTVLPVSGETLTGMAQKFNIPLQDFTNQNPGLNPDTPLPAGKPVNLPFSQHTNLNPSAPPPPGWPDTTPSDPPPPPPPPPGPEPPPISPALTGSLDGCNARLEITPGDGYAAGFRLYVVSPGALEPELLKTFGEAGAGKKLTFLHEKLYGKFVYFAEAFNDKGMTQSVPVNLEVSAQECLVNAKPPANVKLITGWGYDQLYCYATIDSVTQIRMPLKAGTFIAPMPDADLQKWGKETLPQANLSARKGFDLAPYLPQLFASSQAGTTLKFECWAWGVSDLNELGFAEKSLSAADLQKITVIDGKEYQVVGVFGGGPFSGGNKTIELPRPTSLKTTGDPGKCALHFSSSIGQSVCEQFIKSNLVAFVWANGSAYCPPGTENSCTAVNNIDGFHIYHQIPGKPTYVYGVGSGTNVTAGFVPWPQQEDCPWGYFCAVDDRCYTVRAYKGSLESLDSNVVCLDEQEKITGLKTLSLAPSQIGVREVQVRLQSDTNAGPGALPIKIGHSTNGRIDVGYNDQCFGDSGDYYDEFWGQFMFNLDEVKGKPIYSAFLKFTKFDAVYSLNGQEVPGYNCVRALGLSHAEDFSVGYLKTDVIYTTLFGPLADIKTTNQFIYPVDDVVRAWSQGELNTGFVLDGRDPNWPPPQANNYCMNTFGDFKLNITYFPNP